MSTRPILTGIGSLPPTDGATEEALRAAVALQREHGFGLLTDGEPRGDMLSLYASFPGIEMRSGVPRIVARIRPLDDPAGFPKVRDLDLLRAAFPELAFKVALTAPTTFLMAAASTGAGPAYGSALDPTLHEDLTEALRPVAREIGRRGAHLQIDDPILSQGMRDYGPALRRIDAIASEVPRERASLHVCGGLVRSKALGALHRLGSVSTLNLAFAGRSERENLGLLGPGPWDDADMSLGAGCIDVQISDPGDLMGAPTVAALLREIAGRVGEEHIRYVTPDCGLRATPRGLVPSVLENLRSGFERAFPEPR